MTSIAENSKKLRDKLKDLSAAELEKLVRHHNELYWEKDEPEIDDPTYDKLVEALKAKNPNATVLEEMGVAAQPEEPAPTTKKAKKATTSAKKAAPTKAPAKAPAKAKAEPGKKFGQVIHDHPMLSLDKCYDDNTLAKWAKGIKGGYLITPKIDGLACSLRFGDDGTLELAATRGDGKKGDDITQNAHGIKDIPKQLKGGAVEVRGEVYMRLSRFNENYSAKHGKGDKQNPRNLAAGAIKTKDAAESAAYGLSFFAYDLIGTDAKTERDKHKRLKALGFPILPNKFVDDAKDLAEEFRTFVEECKKLDVETDGVVIKADLVAEHDRLGVTAHHPRAAIAYKFQGESALTTVVEIEWSVARTGSVNPIAIIDPIFVSGVTVTRVTLHNANYAKALGIGVGAQVEVVRRGGVIPHIERVLSKPKKVIEFPTKWKVHGGTTGVHLDGDFLYLDEPERCTEVVVDQVEHFAKVIDAKGFGQKVLLSLFDEGLVSSPADLYRLTVDKLTQLDRMGKKSAENLVGVIESKRELTLPVFLESLGLERVGPTVAEKLAEKFGDLAALRKAKEKDLANIDGIGDEIAEAIVRGLHESKHVVDELLKEVTIVKPKAVKDSGSPLFGKSVVFTGGMATMDRKTAQKKVQSIGGKTPSGVSADLDYLVIGDEGSPLIGDGERSTKHKAADKLVAKGGKIKIISETDFLKMLGDAA